MKYIIDGWISGLAADLKEKSSLLGIFIKINSREIVFKKNKRKKVFVLRE